MAIFVHFVFFCSKFGFLVRVVRVVRVFRGSKTLTSLSARLIHQRCERRFENGVKMPI